MVQRQHGHRRHQPDPFGPGGNDAEHDFRRGVGAEFVEMMLADPGGMHAQFLGIDRLVDDLKQQLFDCPGVVSVGVVGVRKVAELHRHLRRPALIVELDEKM